MKNLFLKDKIQRYSFFKLEKKKYIILYIIQNLSCINHIRTFSFFELWNLCNFYSKTKIRNRCVFTNRARGTYKEVRLSRLFLKKKALQGELLGIKKASW